MQPQKPYRRRAAAKALDLWEPNEIADLRRVMGHLRAAIARGDLRAAQGWARLAEGLREAYTACGRSGEYAEYRAQRMARYRGPRSEKGAEEGAEKPLGAPMDAIDRLLFGAADAG